MIALDGGHASVGSVGEEEDISVPRLRKIEREFGGGRSLGIGLGPSAKKEGVKDR